MAIYDNDTSGATSKQVAKVYATDEEGMMADAKRFAKQDFSSVTDTVRRLGFTEEQASDEMIAKALILTKYNLIKEARINRVTFFD